MWDLYKNRKDRLLQMKTCCLVVVKLLIKDNYCYIVLIEICVSTDYITGRNVYNNIFLYEHPWSVLKTDQLARANAPFIAWIVTSGNAIMKPYLINLSNNACYKMHVTKIDNSCKPVIFYPPEF